jgi:hypothetical protein
MHRLLINSDVGVKIDLLYVARPLAAPSRRCKCNQHKSDCGRLLTNRVSDCRTLSLHSDVTDSFIFLQRCGNFTINSRVPYVQRARATVPRFGGDWCPATLEGNHGVYIVSTGDPGNRDWPATRWSYTFVYDLTGVGVDPTLYGLRMRVDFDSAFGAADDSKWYQMEFVSHHGGTSGCESTGKGGCVPVAGDTVQGLAAQGGNSYSLGYANIPAPDSFYPNLAGEGVDVRITGSANYPGFGPPNGFDADEEGRYDIEVEIYELANDNVVVATAMSVFTSSSLVPSFNQCGGRTGDPPCTVAGNANKLCGTTNCQPNFVPQVVAECPVPAPTASPTTSSPTPMKKKSPKKSDKRVTQLASSVSSSYQTASVIAGAVGAAVVVVAVAIMIAFRRSRRFAVEEGDVVNELSIKKIEAPLCESVETSV